jgi:hypothetical protein
LFGWDVHKTSLFFKKMNQVPPAFTAKKTFFLGASQQTLAPSYFVRALVN